MAEMLPHTTGEQCAVSLRHAALFVGGLLERRPHGYEVDWFRVAATPTEGFARADLALCAYQQGSNEKQRDDFTLVSAVEDTTVFAAYRYIGRPRQGAALERAVGIMRQVAYNVAGLPLELARVSTNLTGETNQTSIDVLFDGSMKERYAFQNFVHNQTPIHHNSPRLPDRYWMNASIGSKPHIIEYWLRERTDRIEQ